MRPDSICELLHAFTLSGGSFHHPPLPRLLGLGFQLGFWLHWLSAPQLVAWLLFCCFIAVVRLLLVQLSLAFAYCGKLSDDVHGEVTKNVALTRHIGHASDMHIH